MAVRRLQLITAGSSIAAYCIQNHVAAMGWSLADIAPTVRQTIKEFEEYRKYADDAYDEKYDSVKRLYYDVKPGDIIWMRSRSEGKYYFARVKPESKWVFNENAVSIDAANQLTEIDWYPASDKADEESVPGAVATAFIMGQTLQKIKNRELRHIARCFITGSMILKKILTVIRIRMNKCPTDPFLV